MSFNRPSDTFGQWLDPTAGDLYGLNFTAKTDAENFEQFFQEAVENASIKPEPVRAAPQASPQLVIVSFLSFFLSFRSVQPDVVD